MSLVYKSARVVGMKNKFKLELTILYYLGTQNGEDDIVGTSNLPDLTYLKVSKPTGAHLRTAQSTFLTFLAFTVVFCKL